MGLFSKKNCVVCGGDMGRITDNKIAEGGICHDCARKLSPWYKGLRKATLDEVKQQIAYREENKNAVAAFNTSRTYGQGSTRLMIDDAAGVFMVAKTNNIKDENPDVIPLSSVTGCFIQPDESSYEEKTTNKEGKSVSYIPPRYSYSYDINLAIDVNHPYFNEIKYQINNSSIDIKVVGHRTPDVENNREYVHAIQTAEEAKAALSGQVKANAAAAAAAYEPKKPKKCPACGATSMPDSNGCCEYCGSPLD